MADSFRLVVVYVCLFLLYYLHPARTALSSQITLSQSLSCVRNEIRYYSSKRKKDTKSKVYNKDQNEY